MAPSRALTRLMPTGMTPKTRRFRLRALLGIHIASRAMSSSASQRVSSPALMTTARLSSGQASSFSTGAKKQSSSQIGPEAPGDLSDGERTIYDKVLSALQPTSLQVRDISGGCGSMYALDIASPKFQGLTVVKQHRLVNDLLGEEIKGMHGIQLRTRAL